MTYLTFDKSFSSQLLKISLTCKKKIYNQAVTPAGSTSFDLVPVPRQLYLPFSNNWQRVISLSGSPVSFRKNIPAYLEETSVALFISFFGVWLVIISQIQTSVWIHYELTRYFRYLDWKSQLLPKGISQLSC